VINKKRKRVWEIGIDLKTGKPYCRPLKDKDEKGDDDLQTAIDLTELALREQGRLAPAGDERPNFEKRDWEERGSTDPTIHVKYSFDPGDDYKEGKPEWVDIKVHDKVRTTQEFFRSFCILKPFEGKVVQLITSKKRQNTIAYVKRKDGKVEAVSVFWLERIL
jgi:hypothetical protein